MQSGASRRASPSWGPGLGAPGESTPTPLATQVDAESALDWMPEGEPERTRHAGLGFLEYGGVRMTAPETGTYWIAVSAAQPGATGKYVLAPGVREAFGPGDVVGYAALATFFADPWPPDFGPPGLGGLCSRRRRPDRCRAGCRHRPRGGPPEASEGPAERGPLRSRPTASAPPSSRPC